MFAAIKVRRENRAERKPKGQRLPKPVKGKNPVVRTWTFWTQGCELLGSVGFGQIHKRSKRSRHSDQGAKERGGGWQGAKEGRCEGEGSRRQKGSSRKLISPFVYAWHSNAPISAPVPLITCSRWAEIFSASAVWPRIKSDLRQIHCTSPEGKNHPFKKRADRELARGEHFRLVVRDTAVLIQY